jgi:hypothetical protein
MVNYVIAEPPSLLNFMIADTWSPVPMIWPFSPRSRRGS